MKNKFFALSSFVLLNLLPIYAAPSSSSPSEQSSPSKIIINNRILAHVNGKAISTYDVSKKLSMIFYNQYPEYVAFPEARYQFYEASWKSVLEDLINKELILADAQDKKIEVTSGDVRQEMESMFGPNIIENLDKSGMTFDEAAKIVQGDILIRRMLNFKVNAKALRVVTPAKVRLAYEEYIKDSKNARQTKWTYQVITVKDRNPQKTEETANIAYRLLIEEKVPLKDLNETLKNRKLLGRKGRVTISEPITNTEQELSQAYKSVLLQLEPGMISQPSAQKSRATNSTVYRIFYVQSKSPGGMPAFAEIENRLKDRLLNDIADQETDLYLKKLRQHFRVRDQDLDAMIPPGYQPFILG